MQRSSLVKRRIVFSLIIVLLSISTVAALSEMNVVVFPDIPSTTFSYDFVFSSASSCVPVMLNESLSITTNGAGRGNATISLASLTGVPSYLCTYRDDTLVSVQSLNRNAFEEGNLTVSSGSAGYIPIFANSTNLISWVLSSQLLNATGFDAANITSGTIPDARINVTFYNQTINVSNGSIVTNNTANFVLNITSAHPWLVINQTQSSFSFGASQPVGNVSGTGETGNITYWINSTTLGSTNIGPKHFNNTSSGIAGQVLLYANENQFVWSNKTNVTVITATGVTNWNKPFGASYVTVFICGGGGSGGGGSAAAQGAVRSGGGGGGGGMCVTKTFRIDDLTDPVAVTIGAGGASVAAGADGNGGTSSTFGGYITAFGGGGGAANAAGAGGGGGGGCATVGTSATTATGATGGACFITAVAANTASVHGGGAGGGTAGAGVVNGPNAWLAGAGGGTATTGGAAAGGAGGSSQYSAGGGGGGGGVNAATPGTGQNGGAGGSTGTNVIAAGGGGTAGTAAGACGAAGDGGTGTSGYFGVGGHGGGGGGAKAAAATSGCAGGTGGAFGGGGGGGGGGTNAGVGGAGGKGGDGGAIIIAW